MRILLTGKSGFLGGYVYEELQNQGYRDIIALRKNSYDLTNKAKVFDMFNVYRPEKVIHLAADVGGIGANMQSPGSFFYNNISMGINMVEASRHYKVKHFTFVSTVCSYPKFCSVPFREEDIWNGYPEETNAPYGIAKKSIMQMMRAYGDQYGFKGCCLIPTNLYGPKDHFEESKSHVIPAIIKKFVEAKKQGLNKVECWGTGSATREFLYVEDAARGIVAGMERFDDPSVPINLGSGYEISIKNLVEKIKKIVGYEGEILWDTTKPDGQPRRFLDTTRSKKLLGWESKTDFDTGIKNTIEWYVNADN